MALNSGTKLGSYEIESSLGVGGMGEVYRATGSKLGREVALKVFLQAAQSLSISSAHIRYWHRCMFIQTGKGESRCHSMCSCYTMTAKPGRN